MPKVHVFVGAGPANLHLALKIMQMDSDAEIVILDDRVDQNTKQLHRPSARANIFRFEDDLVTERLHRDLVAAGMDESVWREMISKRNFSVAQGFQYGDDQVFGHADFTQIQIRDLQQLFLDALYKDENRVKLIQKKINMPQDKKPDESIKSQVQAFLGESLSNNEIETHLAPGALRDDKENHALLYPDKTQLKDGVLDGNAAVSPDVDALMVTPSHGEDEQVKIHQHGDSRYLPHYESIKSQVQAFLGESLSNNEIEIHLAPGALRDDKENHALLYPDKTQLKDGVLDGNAAVSPDVDALMVTPSHGTATFFIKDSETKSHIITPEQLSEGQCSLDTTAWEKPLQAFGWDQIRPPRIRVFYANDILYIGAEIPQSMMKMDEALFEAQMHAYTKAIATLVFPGVEEIKKLVPNNVLVSKFKTTRGEHGVVFQGHEDEQVKIHQHGDSRYLPHYQTGSGFVTAFLQNELYADIYQHQTFGALYYWAISNPKGHPLINKDKISSMQLFKLYKQKLGDAEVSEEKILKAFKDELFMAGTRDIIDKNKEKVGRYLNALHRQELLAMEKNYGELVKLYQKSASAADMKLPTVSEFKKLDRLERWNTIVHMLKQDNIPFIRQALARLLNMNINDVDDERLKELRNFHVIDYERQLTKPFVALTFAYEMQTKLRGEILKDPSHKDRLIQHLKEVELITNKFIHELGDESSKNDDLTKRFEKGLSDCVKRIPERTFMEIIKDTLVKLKALLMSPSITQSYKDRHAALLREKEQRPPPTNKI